jgi:hypothetical protein
MHESGLIRRLIDLALQEAEGRGGALRAIHVRLGALAGGTEDHLRDHFEHELATMDLGDIQLHMSTEPDHPAGIEITAVEIAEPAQ